MDIVRTIMFLLIVLLAWGWMAEAEKIETSPNSFRCEFGWVDWGCDGDSVVPIPEINSSEVDINGSQEEIV